MPETTEPSALELMPTPARQIVPFGTPAKGLIPRGKGYGLESIKVRTKSGLTVHVPASVHSNRHRFNISVHHTLLLVEEIENKMRAAMGVEGGDMPTARDMATLAEAKKLLWGVSLETYEDNAAAANPTGPAPSTGPLGLVSLVCRRVQSAKAGSPVPEMITTTEEAVFRAEGEKMVSAVKE